MNGKEAFENWSGKFDTGSNEYLDMGADEYFIAGYESRQPEIDALKDKITAKERVLETMRGVEKILRDDLENLFNENAALKAENERLRKAAGDAAELLMFMRMNAQVTPGMLPSVERVQSDLLAIIYQK